VSETDKIKNILAFIVLLFGEDDHLYYKMMDFPPDYLLDKFARYILSHKYEADWGLHPSLRRSVFNIYCKKYDLPISEE